MLEQLVSVIITVYNLEKYLEDCILSVINQTYKNIEIIIVNDGSIDESSNIINKYRKVDKRINVIDSSNKGLSNARNIGMDYASGEYIIFIDGDDICLPKMVEIMYSTLIKKNADICICNVIRINDNIITTQAHEDDYCLDIDAYDRRRYIYDFFYNYKHAFCVWNRMYKKDILIGNGIRFRDYNQIYPEDLLFNLEMVLVSHTIAWVNKPLYIHIVRENGLTKGYRKNIVYRYINCCQLFKNCLIEKNMYSEMKQVFYYVVQQETLCALISLLRNNNSNLRQLYSGIKSIYDWDFVVEGFGIKVSNNVWRRLISRSIKKKHSLFTAIILYILYYFNVNIF